MAGQEPQLSHAEQDGEPPKNSVEDHRRTYDAFMNLTKWAITVVALLLIGMAIFLV